MEAGYGRPKKKCKKKWTYYKFNWLKKTQNSRNYCDKHKKNKKHLNKLYSKEGN